MSSHSISIVNAGSTFRKGLSNGMAVSWDLVRVILPLSIAVSLAERAGYLQAVARVFEPLMGVFGLPGEASLALITGWFVFLYAPLGIIVGFGLTAREITILGVMLSIAHNLVVESAVLVDLGVRAKRLVLVRLAVSFAAGIALNVVLP